MNVKTLPDDFQLAKLEYELIINKKMLIHKVITEKQYYEVEKIITEKIKHYKRIIR